MQAAAPAQTFPWSWYVDPAVLAAEQERVFRRCWQYVARIDQVVEPGRFVATRAADVPVVVVRGHDGELRAFLNVCRHRGSLVCEGEGRRETLQCPYHAWTYDLDGVLRSAPRADREPGFDGDGVRLLRLQVGTWGPFVFVNPDATAAPLTDVLGALPSLLAGGGLDVGELRFLRRVEAEYEANWKICCENYLECYHCQVAHPGFSRVVDVSPDAYRLDTSAWFSSQYGPVRDRPAGVFDAGGAIERGQFHFLFPNTTLNVMPGRPNLSIGPVIPHGTERTYRFLDYFVAPDASEEWIDDFLAFDDQVGAEDRALVERVQAGVRSGLLDGGRLLPKSERLIAHFQGLLVEALGK
jgi:phenylpropionate dioxygenase-like ring-hydroxylating dioxygenase large terminal subunit